MFSNRQSGHPDQSYYPGCNNGSTRKTAIERRIQSNKEVDFQRIPLGTHYPTGRSPSSNAARYNEFYIQFGYDFSVSQTVHN